MTETPFGDLDDFFALPRVSGLAVSPDGSRVVTTVSELGEKRTEYVTAIWELDPKGVAPGRRLTRGAKGESAPAFTSKGDLLFVAVRPTDDDDKPPAALWNLPAAGGEAVEVLAPPGGVDAVKTARDKAVAVVRAPLLPSARSFEDDHRLRDLRKDNKITAILHTGYPIRHWDRDLGPGAPHLLALNLADDATPTDLTPRPAGALRDADFDVSADGSFLVTSWQRPAPGASQRSVLVRVDLASGEHSVIADEPGADLWSPTDLARREGRWRSLRESYSTPQHAPRISLRYMRFGESPAELVADWDRWPASVTWSRDGDALLVTADDGGRCPVFRLDIADRRDPAADHRRLRLHGRDGRTRRHRLRAAQFVRGAAAPGAHRPRRHRHAAAVRRARPRLPGSLTEVTGDRRATGRRCGRGWCCPRGDAPAPLLLWVHGGPLGSWNSWHWRWNPWVLAARGYAVLLPDPALSTGYGQDFIQRGWGAWGSRAVRRI